MISQLDRHGEKKGDTATYVGVKPVAPDILIHLHIPKTGGTSLNSLVQHGFRNNEVFGIEVFDDMGPECRDGLGLARYDYCLQLLAGCKTEDLRRIRYVTGHLPLGLHRAFDGHVKCFTVVRHPFDRVISEFFFRIQEGNPTRNDGRTLSLEEYVESNHDVHLSNYQVRVVAGSPALDDKGVPVEFHHLEEAKRNISEYFLAAAPLESMAEMALMIRRIYGWPMRRLLTEYKNKTRRRLRVRDVSPRVRKMIEESNAYDLELYEWVRKRFAMQSRLFEPQLSTDRRILNLVSHALNGAGQILPWQVRKRLAQKLFYA
jgi:Sulfotransferase family